MSNITKAFEAKQGLRSANLPGYAGGFVQKLFGGAKPAPAAPVVDPRIAQIEASQRELAKSQGAYGSAPAAVAAQVVSAAPTQQVAPVGVSLSSAVGAIQSRNEALKAAAGYKDGRVPVHEGPGIVHGPGTSTSDSVNAKLSKDEAVLPAATVAALGGTEAVAELIERTNGEAPARGLRDGVLHAATGFPGDTIDPRELRPEFRSVAQTPVIQPAANAGLESARNGRAAAVMNNVPNQPNTGPQQPPVNTSSFDDEVRARAQAARGMRNAQGVAPASAVEPAATKAGNPYNPNINPAEILKSVGENKAVQMGGKAAKLGLKTAPYVAGAVDASGVVDVATDPNKSKADVATEVARDMGRWGSATATGTAAAGASLPFAPMAGPAAPAVPIVAGLLGGAAGYFGADKLMDVGSGQLSPSSTSYGAVKKTLGLKDPNAGAAEKAANEAALNGGNGGGVIPGMLSKEQLKAQASAGLRKTQRDNIAFDTSPAGIAHQARLDAASGKTATAAASKAGSFPGQNRIPEAVTVQDQAASDMMGKEVDKLTGVSSTGDQGVRGMAQRMDSYANNESARQARNAQLQLRGDGARYEKGADGKITLTNSGDFDGSTKMPYTGADGKPTAVFAGSMENQRGIADAKGMRKQLANIEQMNLERNAKDDITDVGLRTYSRGVLKDQAAQNAKYNETMLSKQPSQLDLIKDDRDERKFQNDINNVAQMQRNNVRDHKAKQTEYMAKRSQTLLDNLFPTAGLKGDALKSAQQNRSDAEVALYAAAKSMPANDGEFDKAVPAMESQMRLTMAHKKAMQDQGIWQKLRNAGRDPITTLVSMEPKIVGDDFVYENGYKLPTKLVLGNDPALLAAHNARVNAK